MSTIGIDKPDLETLPDACEAASDGARLAVTWPDGRRSDIDAATLWRECPSAVGRRRRMDGRNQPPPGVRLVGVSAIGRYGVNLAFSDGHDRGIYPWFLLAALASRPRAEDFIIPDDRPASLVSGQLPERCL